MCPILNILPLVREVHRTALVRGEVRQHLVYSSAIFDFFNADIIIVALCGVSRQVRPLAGTFNKKAPSTKHVERISESSQPYSPIQGGLHDHQTQFTMEASVQSGHKASGNHPGIDTPSGAEQAT